MELNEKPTSADTIVRDELGKLQAALTTLNQSLFRTRAVLHGRLDQAITVELKLFEEPAGQFVTAHIVGQLFAAYPIGERQMSPNSWQKLLGDNWHSILHADDDQM